MRNDALMHRDNNNDNNLGKDEMENDMIPEVRYIHYLLTNNL